MKQLNFYPYYENLIRNKLKTTTIRLGDQRDLFTNDDIVDISIGWDIAESMILTQGIITSVFYKRIKELTVNDIDGESPDCKNLSSIKYVLSSIYRKVVSDEDSITVIKWRYV